MTDRSHQEGKTLGSWLAARGTSTRVLLCLAVASTLAVYGSLLVLAIPGVTTHLLGQLKYNLMSIALVLVFGWFGYRSRRPWLYGGILATVLLLMWGLQAVLPAPPHLVWFAIWNGWPYILMSVAWPLLQICIFERLMDVAGGSSYKATS
jgi:hypothetical protein